MALKSAKKSVILAGVLVIGLIVVIVAFRYTQLGRIFGIGEAAVFSVQPLAVSLKNSDIQEFQIVIDPQNNPAVFAHADITFDKSVLESVEIRRAERFSRSVTTTNITDANSSGRITIAAGIEPQAVPLTSPFELATLRFRVKTTNSGNTTISVVTGNNFSQVVMDNGQPLNVSVKPSVISLNSSTGSSPVYSPQISSLSHIKTVTGTSNNPSVGVSSGEVSGGNNLLYVASISTKPNGTVSSVNGLGLQWRRAGAQCGGRGNTRTEVWYAFGSPTSAGTITARLQSTQNMKGMVISVSSFSGANSLAPIGNIVTINSNGISDSKCEGGNDDDRYSATLTGTSSSMLYSAVSIRHYNHTPGSGFTELAQVKTSIGNGDDAGVAVMIKTGTNGSNSISGSVSSDVDYALVAVELKSGSQIAQGPTATVRSTSTPVVRSSSTPTSTPRVSSSPTLRPTPTTTVRATSSPRPSASPTPIPPVVSGDFPCGKFPNANPGCMNVSYQSWFDNVPASAETMNVNYTPRLLHQHYECAVPAARVNGQYLRQPMKIHCQMVRYNSIVPFTNSNAGWYRSCNQGNCYEQYSLNLPACQNSKYEGKECKTDHVHTVRSTDMSSNTEMRFMPNANFLGMGGTRHFLSSNWQTGIGYRNSSEFTARYWIGECGDYQRVILPQVDKFMRGNEAIPTVRGTISIPFTTNGGCGTQFKTFVFLDPSQHTREFGSQSGTTLLETNGHYSGNLVWDTTKTSNGVHSLLFINMEGTNQYVSAAGVAVRFNVQN